MKKPVWQQPRRLGFQPEDQRDLSAWLLRPSYEDGNRDIYLLNTLWKSPLGGHRGGLWFQEEGPCVSDFCIMLSWGEL